LRARLFEEDTVNLTIPLAGHTADWRFRDSAALSSWLASAPWQGRGAVRVVRISSAELAPTFLAALRREVRAHDDGRSGVSFHELRPDDLPIGLAAAVAELLEVPGGLNRLETLQETARRLAGRPGVVLVPPPVGAAAPRPQVLDETRDWLERLRRAGSGVQLAVLLLDTPRQRLGGQVFDLSVGLPVDRLLAGPGANTGALWRGYLHHRLAWESAGDPARAAEMGRAAAKLSVGAESEFERLLNESARAAHDALSGSLRQDAKQYLEERVKPVRSRGWLTQRAADLEQQRLLWRPRGTANHVPAPWLARAFLLNRSVQLCDFQLRDCLVCAPLAHELLDRCFDLEGQERAGLWARRSDRAPPDRAVERWQSFQEAGSFQAGLYPPECPARPEDGWPFATFGEFLSVMAPGDSRRDVWYDLLNLRNHVAHGHYVSWAAVEKLREIEDALP
jgi:hypothetical protein